MSVYIFECDNVENVFRPPNYLYMQKKDFKIIIGGDSIGPKLSKNIYFVRSNTSYRRSKVPRYNAIDC